MLVIGMMDKSCIESEPLIGFCAHTKQWVNTGEVPSCVSGSVEARQLTWVVDRFASRCRPKLCSMASCLGFVDSMASHGRLGSLRYLLFQVELRKPAPPAAQALLPPLSQTLASVERMLQQVQTTNRAAHRLMLGAA